MKNNKQVSSFLKQMPLMVALLAALVFSAGSGLQHFLQEDVQPRQLHEQEQEQQDDDRPFAYLDYASSALAPVAQLIFSHQFVVEVLQPPVFDVQEIYQYTTPLRADRYFRTLFRIIISPNAP